MHSNLIPLNVMVDTQRKSESQDGELSISGKVKGHHHCCFEVNTGKHFTAPNQVPTLNSQFIIASTCSLCSWRYSSGGKGKFTVVCSHSTQKF